MLLSILLSIYILRDRHSLLSSPGLQATDGINLCNIDDGSQGFQSSTTSFPNLKRWDDYFVTLIKKLISSVSKHKPVKAQGIDHDNPTNPYAMQTLIL